MINVYLQYPVECDPKVETTEAQTQHRDRNLLTHYCHPSTSAGLSGKPVFLAKAAFKFVQSNSICQRCYLQQS
jgi:hypothetical protein